MTSDRRPGAARGRRDVAEQRKPWDQQEGEPAEAYARFLAYRNLGPGRSLRAAEDAARGEEAPKSTKKHQVSGQWKQDSATYQWVERSTAWDIENLVTHGQRTVVNYVAALNEYSQRLVEVLAGGNVVPESWSDMQGAIEFLGRFIPSGAPERLYLARPGADHAAGRDGDAGAAPDPSDVHRGDGQDHP